MTLSDLLFLAAVLFVATLLFRIQISRRCGPVGGDPPVEPVPGDIFLASYAVALICVALAFPRGFTLPANAGASTIGA